MEDKILDYGDVLLRRQDALLLLGNNWLNDQVIGFFFEYLAREAFPGLEPCLLLVPGSAAYLLASLGDGGAAVVLEPHGFPSSTQLVLFAVNNNPDASVAGGGSHWSLLAWSAAGGAFRHYDSMAGSNADAARRVADAAAASLTGRARARVLEQRSPQQQNAFDCGVYVLAVARLLCARYATDGAGMSLDIAPGDVSPEDVTALRQEVYALIAGKAAEARSAGGLPLLES